MSRQKRLLLVAGAIALALAVVRPSRPHADLAILTHRAGDTAPQQVHAAVDLGILAVSVLVTWSRQLGR
ncbi:hypothetical protein [Sphingomonas azotifigens]|uniref:hypothetical protein n=1 Tax=Sphingomonas azotifigens TaxID=330920 RepID=UPI0009FE2B6B|nr:hypothetical protein [Sphingomonas azotifigens]